ncbi:MAG: hypothetical protein AB7H66_08340 [Hyphomonadaceae bacterium]
MSLEQWSNLGDLAGAIAVVASLVFVGVQVRQFTEATRAQTRQHIASSWFELSNLVIQNPHTFTAGLRSTAPGFGDLVEDDRTKFVSILFALFKHYENMFLEHRDGRVDAEVWAPWPLHMRIYFHQPGAQTFWVMRKDAYTTSFQAFLESTEKPVAPSLGDLSDALAPAASQGSQ